MLNSTDIMRYGGGQLASNGEVGSGETESVYGRAVVKAGPAACWVRGHGGGERLAGEWGKRCAAGGPPCSVECKLVGWSNLRTCDVGGEGLAER